jgi:uncharacterized OsmC-like protein
MFATSAPPLVVRSQAQQFAVNLELADTSRHKNSPNNNIHWKCPMHISAQVNNVQGKHVVNVRTNGNTQSLTIPPKSMGFGSGVSGGELLFLSLATCYCNDIYREAANKGINVTGVEVTVEGEFGGPGEPARSVTYNAKVSAYAPKNEIDDLIKHTDTVAEIQNTLRKATQVTLNGVEAISL